jgi:hypothetical protein
MEAKYYTVTPNILKTSYFLLNRGDNSDGRRVWGCIPLRVKMCPPLPAKAPGFLNDCRLSMKTVYTFTWLAGKFTQQRSQETSTEQSLCMEHWVGI